MPTPTPSTGHVVTVCFAPGEDADWFAASEKVNDSCMPTAPRPAATTSGTGG